MSADTTPGSELLAAYLADRDAERAREVDRILDQLNSWERHLVHDAAVMGYVQGLMRDRDEDTPKGSQIVRLVVDACTAFPDLYPAIRALQQGEVPRPSA